MGKPHSWNENSALLLCQNDSDQMVPRKKVARSTTIRYQCSGELVMSILFESTVINGMSLANRFVRSATWEGYGHHGRSLHEPSYRHDDKCSLREASALSSPDTVM